MNSFSKIIAFTAILLTLPLVAQHHSAMDVVVDDAKKTLEVKQELTFFNESSDTLSTVILNDWNNAYSAKNTPLAKRFSDEFVRSFHLAKEEERGHTNVISISDSNQNPLIWERPKQHPDLIEIKLSEKILPGQKVTFLLSYIVKIPSDKFTKFGYRNNGGYNLKNWYLTPARYENHAFLKYSNNNLEDIANGVSDIDLKIVFPENLQLISDLDISEKTKNQNIKTFYLNGKGRLDFSLIFDLKSTFQIYRNDFIEVENSLEGKKVDDIKKAIIVDRILHFVHDNIGSYPNKKITVSETDYERNPFYGLNQFPSFINVFEDDFLYELKFLKTYLNNYLKNTLQLDPRKDNWIYDGIQVHAMMQYIEENHPQMKMTGSLSNLRILKSYNIANIDFNDQYSYFYMLMARKNLDQPVGDPKNRLIKFNEQIAGKYRAGLSLRYLDSYLGDSIISNSIKKFYIQGKQKQVGEADFESIVKENTTKNTDWFFKTVIHSREIIDYKFTDIEKTSDSVTVTIKNKTGTNVPFPIYGVKKGEVVFKQWLDGTANDTTITFQRNGADKIVLNYKNEVPEYNLRNNWKSLKPFSVSNRPFKFVFFKDLEDPYYNQILYVPSLSYNLYDGLMPGLRFYNKTILDKPFTIDFNPAYSTNTQSLIGSLSLAVNQNYRESRLYNLRYFVTGSYFHYAPDAAYLKINPTVQFRFRQEDLRDNRKQFITLRQVILHRDRTNFMIDGDTENYSVFNARYSNVKTEVTSHTNFSADFQASGKFGKASAEMQFRKLFDNNRQVNLRLYAGTFLYNKTDTDYFSFALDRPTDYLFDYNYYGRSETSGLFSQQLILAEGGFKSKLDTPFANQWITTANLGFNIWNWVEVYGDVGMIKNKFASEKFVYDSGIRLNLVTDYFELYFPVYSNNGWEIAQPNYGEKIRFIVTLSPGTLINLFTRKWF